MEMSRRLEIVLVLIALVILTSLVLSFVYAPSDRVDDLFKGFNNLIGVEGEDNKENNSTTDPVNDTSEDGNNRSLSDDTEGSSSNSGGEDGVNEEGCSSIEDVNERDWCYRNKALEDEDASVCEKIEKDWNRDSCYRYLAMETSNETYCESMQNEDRKAFCFETVEM